MPTTFQQLFTAIGQRNISPVERHLPMINSVSSSVNGFIYEVNQMNRKKKLMNWLKTIPELNAFVMKIARDVTSKFHFEPTNKTASGRNKILVANKFVLQNQIRDTMFSQVVDIIATGDGYGWTGKLQDKQVKDIIKKAYNRMLPTELKTELKSVETKYLQSLYNELKATEDIGSTAGIDEALLIPRKYRYVPSTTVENIHDNYDFKGYMHLVGGKKVAFTPEEMIHYTFMNVDGKPNGFTSVESVIVQLELLRFMWQNMLSIQRNGGMPDKMIIVKDMDSNNPSFKRMEEMLHKYKLVENKHGNMLFTGDIDIKDINSIDDMQFKELGLYITGLLAMQWGISKEAIPFIVGGTNTKVEGGGAAEDSYFEVIEWMQTIFAEDMNTQLWIPYFGVKLMFDSPNLQRDIRIQTAKMNKFNNIITMDTILLKSGKQISEQRRLELLDLDETDVEEWKPDPQQEMQMQQEEANAAKGMGTPAQQSTKDKSKQDQQHSAKKKLEQEQTIANRGKKPSGTGAKSSPEIKEFDDATETEYKQIIGQETMSVEFDTFLKLYNEDKIHDQGGLLRIFMRTNELFTSLTYKSTDFVYKTVIKNEDIDEGRISFMNFTGKLYKL